MRLHRVPLSLCDRADVDDGAEIRTLPAPGLGRERVHVCAEIGGQLAKPIEDPGGNDHPITAPHMHMLAELRLVPRDAGERHSPQRELAGRDVIGMTVAAVRTPGDDDVGPGLPKPADDVPDHRIDRSACKRAVGIAEGRRRGEPHPAAGFRELGGTDLTEPLGRDGRGTGRRALAGVAAGQRQAVTHDAGGGVSQESATGPERLVIRMREDRREAEWTIGQRPDTSIRTMSGTRVVVVEDDASVAELVTLYLKNAGFVVEHCPTAAAARIAFAQGAPACVVLDLGLPDADGLALFTELRRMHDSPVIALTARAEDVQKVTGLDAGLDDYLTKPFNPRELVARVNAVVRRATGAGGTRPLEVGDLILDPARHEVTVAGRAVALRAKEFELLEAFCRQPGIVLTRDKLLENVWGFAYPGETRTVDVHVKQLRDKLNGATAKIETVWGVGYKLVPPNS